MQQQQRSSDNIAVGDVIRDERERLGISVRELARRAAISAGQISRIENGEVSRPSGDTLRALARGLGGHPLPLLYLAGHASVEQIQELDERLAHSSDIAADLSDWVNEAGDGPRELAQALFLASAGAPFGLGLDELGLDPELQNEIRELARAWPALTPERRRLVRAMVSDQEVLSALDRLPAAHGRYRFSIELEELERGDADDEVGS